jgi:hypothetical protein
LQSLGSRGETPDGDRDSLKGGPEGSPPTDRPRREGLTAHAGPGGLEPTPVVLDELAHAEHVVRRPRPGDPDYGFVVTDEFHRHTEEELTELARKLRGARLAGHGGGCLVCPGSGVRCCEFGADR